MKKIAIEGFSFCEGGVCAAKGFQANGIHCGLAKKALTAPVEDAAEQPKVLKKDLALILADTRCTAAAMYTTNKVKGAPLTVTKEHLKNGMAQAVIINSVNANTCNADGAEKAQEMCRLAAKELGLPEEDVLVASTGVIGQPLPIEPIADGIPALCKGLSATGNTAAVEAIMTTDTMPKEVAVEFQLGGTTCKLGGMLKGSGMIHPNMATTLTFLTTDAAVSQELLQRALRDVVRVTLNRVSVDGDTSTNDMVVVLANGAAGNPCVNKENEAFETLKNALSLPPACLRQQCLAKMQTGDGFCVPLAMRMLLSRWMLFRSIWLLSSDAFMFAKTEQA